MGFKIFTQVKYGVGQDISFEKKKPNHETARRLLPSGKGG
jgi:hypothetical protein